MLGLPFGHSHPHFANRFYFSLFLYFHFLKNLYLSLSLSLGLGSLVICRKLKLLVAELWNGKLRKASKKHKNGFVSSPKPFPSSGKRFLLYSSTSWIFQSSNVLEQDSGHNFFYPTSRNPKRKSRFWNKREWEQQ